MSSARVRRQYRNLAQGAPVLQPRGQPTNASRIHQTSQGNLSVRRTNSFPTKLETDEHPEFPSNVDPEIVLGIDRRRGAKRIVLDRVPKDMIPPPSPRASTPTFNKTSPDDFQPRYISSSRSVVTMSVAAASFEEDMPMDEAQDRIINMVSFESARGDEGVELVNPSFLPQSVPTSPIRSFDEKAESHLKEHLREKERELEQIRKKMFAQQHEIQKQKEEIEAMRSSASKPLNQKNDALVENASRGYRGRREQPSPQRQRSLDTSRISQAADAAVNASLQRLLSRLQSISEDNPSKAVSLMPLEQKVLLEVEEMLSALQEEHELQKKELYHSGPSKQVLELRHQLQEVTASRKRQEAGYRNEKLRNEKRVSELEGRLAEVEADYEESLSANESLQGEHDRAVRAIQRVLADVSASKDEAIENLQEQLQAAQTQNLALSHDVEVLNERCSAASDNEQSIQEIATLRARAKRSQAMELEAEKLRDQVQEIQQKYEEALKEQSKKGGTIAILTSELRSVKNELLRSKEETTKIATTLEERNKKLEEMQASLDSSHQELETMRSDAEKTGQQLESQADQIEDLKKHISSRKGETNGENQQRSKAAAVLLQVELKDMELKYKEVLEEQEKTRMELQEKASSLENAKKIIASLEQSNGSLAFEMRAKLKEKESDVVALRHVSDDRKAKIARLEAELAELKRKQANSTHSTGQSQGQALGKKIDEAVSQSNEGTLASNQNDTLIDQMSHMFRDSLCVLEKGFSESRLLVKIDDQSNEDASDGAIEISSETESSDLQKQMNDRIFAFQMMEKELKTNRENVAELQQQIAKMNEEREKVKASAESEIQRLRNKCTANAELLSKKELELRTLRDTLDEPPVGYISDDDDDDDEGDADSGNEERSYAYSLTHGQFPALALQASFAGNDQEASSQLQMLKKQLTTAQTEKEKADKDLKSQKESLANAKMIISSLERANKSMLEDLRSRLHDSNTAIASLLDKSMQSDKTANALRVELEELRKQRALESKKSESTSENSNNNLDSRKTQATEKGEETEEKAASLLKTDVLVSP